MASPKILYFAVFGAGRAGSFHMPNILRHPKCRLLYVIDSNFEVAKKAAETFDCKALQSGEEALADPKVNAVIIATTTPTHHELVMKALAAGKPNLTEKPVGFTLREVDEVYEEAKNRHLPLLCAFNRRFDASWMKAQQYITSGNIGTPQIVRSTARDSPVPSVDYLKTSHGFFHDSGVHDIDVMCWMMGDFPIEVYASTHCYLPQIAEIQDVDTIVMMFKFKNGCMATIDLSRKCSYGYDQRVEVYGDKGMVQVNNKPTTSVVLSTQQGELHDNIMFSFPQRFADAYFAELDHFVEIVTEGKTPRVSHVDCRNSFIICETAMESAKLAKPVAIDYSKKDTASHH